MTKQVRQTRRNTEEKQPAPVPPGYLPIADPPRRSALLLGIAAVVFAIWMLVLAYLAFSNLSR